MIFWMALAVGGAGGGQQLEEGGLAGGEEDTLLFGPLQRHPVVGGLAAGEAVGNQIRLVAVGLRSMAVWSTQMWLSMPQSST